MHGMLNTAITAARKAGNHIMHAYDNKRNMEITAKGLNDYVTQVDKNAEQIIIDTLLDAYPKHSIIAEESGERIRGDAKYQWIIDPLDGTLNFIHGFPHFCVSIALRINNVLEYGVIYDPVRNELFTATRGSGASLDNRRIRVTNISTVENSFLATGFPVRQPEEFDNYLNTFNTVIRQAQDIRRAGSAALDLAYVACGRLDGYWESGLKIWDLAAGSLLVTEAGGYVGDYNGSENHLTTGDVIASNMKLFKQLVKVVKTCKTS